MRHLRSGTALTHSKSVVAPVFFILGCRSDTTNKVGGGGRFVAASCLVASGNTADERCRGESQVPLRGWELRL